jgi:transposase
MLFINPLSGPEIVTLQAMHKFHPLTWSRMRAHAILLSDEGYSVQEIAQIYGVCRQTVSSWIKAWESQGLVGLVDQSRSGRPRKLSAQEESEVLESLRSEPRSIKQALAELEKRLGIQVSVSTIKRLCKRAGLVWKRVRKSLKNKRDAEAFEASLNQIEALLEQEAKGEIEVYYFDESGFTRMPCIAYAWQPVGETIEVCAAPSRRLNVLGFMNRDNQFESFVFEGTVNSSVVVACFDRFCQIIDKKTVVILDNAPAHTSEEFMMNIDKWRQHNLHLEFIPPYSPELNLIEILWRKIKYEWLPFSAYESFSNLKKELMEILASIGEEYTINFA